jgi:nicotinamidase-related amidase
MYREKRILLKIILSIIGSILIFVVVVFINLLIAERNGGVISEGKPIPDYGVQRPALLVVDIQEATTGELSIYPSFRENSEILLQNINQVIDTFQTRNLPVVYVRSEITNPLINLINSAYAKGSPGAKFDKRLKIVSELEVVKKVKDSFRDTPLDSMLVAGKISELYIVGLDAAECVNATAEAAQNRGYRVTIVEEAVISKSKAETDSMLKVFKGRGARLIELDSLTFKVPGNL